VRVPLRQVIGARRSFPILGNLAPTSHTGAREVPINVPAITRRYARCILRGQCERLWRILANSYEQYGDRASEPRGDSCFFTSERDLFHLRRRREYVVHERRVSFRLDPDVGRSAAGRRCALAGNEW